MQEAGASLFIINMSHTDIRDLESTTKSVQDWSGI